MPENGIRLAQPTAVSVPGTHNSEMGCPSALGVNGDWAPDCDQAQIGLDANDRIWKKRDVHPARRTVRLQGSDQPGVDRELRCAGGGSDNIDYETDGTVTFYYDHATHWATSDEEGVMITVPGSFQTEARVQRRLGSCLHATVAPGQGRRRGLRDRHDDDPGGDMAVQGRARPVLHREPTPRTTSA